MNPSNTTNADNPLGIAPVGSLLAKFAIPAIISMLVNALYNIVDQILSVRVSECSETLQQTSHFRSQRFQLLPHCSSVSAAHPTTISKWAPAKSTKQAKLPEVH